MRRERGVTGLKVLTTPMSFTGEEMDNECGTEKSHDRMMKKEGFKSTKECTLGCEPAFLASLPSKNTG